MFSGLDVASIGWSIVIFSEGLKMFGFSIMKPSFSFTNVKTITIPAICSVNNSGLLWTVLVRKERFYASSALKNDVQVNTRVEFVHTRFEAFSDLVALQTLVGKQDNDIFLRNCRRRIAMLMSVFVENIVDMIVDYALWVAVLKKEFSKIIEGRF